MFFNSGSGNIYLLDYDQVMLMQPLGHAEASITVLTSWAWSFSMAYGL